MKDGYDGPMNGPMRGFPLVRCQTHVEIWHRSNKPCPACEEKAKKEQACSRCSRPLKDSRG